MKTECVSDHTRTVTLGQVRHAALLYQCLEPSLRRRVERLELQSQRCRKNLMSK